jgi:hypothetical protein
MEFNVNDPKNIVGMSALMSDDNSKAILELEKQIINGTNLQEEEDVDAKQFKRDMERISKTYDMNNFSFDEEPGEGNYFNDINTSIGSGGGGGGGSAGSSDPIVESSKIYPSNSYSSNNNDSYDTNASYNNQSKSSSRSFVPQVVEDNQLRFMTLEQKKQTYVDDVLHDIIDDRDDEFNMDKEREEDDKNSLLEQIEMLRMQLEDDGTDIANIPLVNKNTSMTDIQNIYKRLKLKNDRNRYCSFAEELIQAGAYGMEYLFDGEKEWFGRKPDLVGWSKTVQIKLRRCRYQTSTFVKEIMQEYHMSSGMQLLIELVPSMFLFSRRKKLSTQENRTNEDMKYNDAFSNLNNL